jgi:cardiolipin synthase
MRRPQHSQTEHRTNGQRMTVASHVLLLGLFLALQIAFIIVMGVVFTRYITHYVLICEFISVCVVLYIVQQDTNPSYKIPWIILNLVMPIMGGPAYIMFGKVRFSKGEQKRAKDAQFEYLRAAFHEPDKFDKLRQQAPDAMMQASYIRNNAGAPVFENTQVEYFSVGEEMFARMVPELENAKKSIFLEYFIINPGIMWNTVEDILTRKAAEGLDVRLMYDDIGCMGLVPADFVRRLESKGIQCCIFNRFTNVFSARFNNRDHRKLCIIDGNVGFTGGINLADEYINARERFGHWKDTAVMLRGQGVWSMTCMFLSLWSLLKHTHEDYAKYRPELAPNVRGFVQPFTDSPWDTERVGETVYGNMLHMARKYVYITTPYLIIDDEMVNALSVAAKSGVDVRIITPGIPDKKVAYTLTRSYYDVLLKSGVRIFEYEPGFIHAKQFVSDDCCAVVGTINLDYRSLCHHYECAVWMHGVDAVKDVRDDTLATMDKCREVTLEMCRNRRFIWRVWLAVLRIFAPLF